MSTIISDEDREIRQIARDSVRDRLFTIRWTKSDGAIQYPINPGPISREIAEAWAKHGEVGGWKGEVIPWEEYEDRAVEV